GSIEYFGDGFRGYPKFAGGRISCRIAHPYTIGYPFHQSLGLARSKRGVLMAPFIGVGRGPATGLHFSDPVIDLVGWIVGLAVDGQFLGSSDGHGKDGHQAEKVFHIEQLVSLVSSAGNIQKKNKPIKFYVFLTLEQLKNRTCPKLPFLFPG